MSLVDHLRELRTRLLRSAIALTVGVLASYAFYQPLFAVLTRPYCSLPAKVRGVGIAAATGQLGGGSCPLYFFHPLDAFAIRIRVAIIAGLVLSSPVWLWQLWAFITPGLRRNERRYALSFVGAGAGLFAGGVAMAYVTLPKALQFLLGAVGNNAIPLTGIDQYIGFATSIMLAFGVSFEFPLVIVMLNLAGVVSHRKLAGWRRPEIVLVTVAAAAITPSQDPFTMLAMAIPMWLLYEAALVVTRTHDRRLARRAGASPFVELPDDEPSPMPLPAPAPEPSVVAGTAGPEHDRLG